ncbi:hypothetical protein FRC11_002153, partial [Ceratobasidium sp. 423]
MKALRGVFAAWGEMVPLVAVVGACMAATGTLGSKQTLTGDSATFRPPDRGPDVMQMIDRNLDITGNFERRFESRIQGGHPEIFSESGFNAWLDDAVKNDNSSTWRVVKVSRGVPVTDLLSKSLQQKVHRLFSYGNTVSRTMARGVQLPFSFDGASLGTKDMKRIDVWYDANGMKDISIVYVDGSQAGPYGFGKAPNNKASDSIVLSQGEFITHIFVWCWSAAVIKAMQFVKNTYEVSMRYGDSTDAGWVHLFSQEGNALLGFSGSCDANFLTQLQAVWRHDVRAEDFRSMELTNVVYGNATTFNDYRFLGDPGTAYISQIRFRNTVQAVTYSSKLGGSVVHQQTPIRGTDAGAQDIWTLAEGEHIIKVNGKSVNAVVYQLEFVTNKGNTK